MSTQIVTCGSYRHVRFADCTKFLSFYVFHISPFPLLSLSVERKSLGMKMILDDVQRQ